MYWYYTNSAFAQTSAQFASRLSCINLFYSSYFQHLFFSFLFNSSHFLLLFILAIIAATISSFPLRTLLGLNKPPFHSLLPLTSHPHHNFHTFNVSLCFVHLSSLSTFLSNILKCIGNTSSCLAFDESFFSFFLSPLRFFFWGVLGSVLTNLPLLWPAFRGWPFRSHLPLSFIASLSLSLPIDIPSSRHHERSQL